MECWINCVLEWVTKYKELITSIAMLIATIAAIITVIIAKRGLNEWKRHLKFKTGLKLMKILYKARDTLAKETVGKPNDKIDNHIYRNNYANKEIIEWEKEFYDASNEVEYHFGTKIQEKAWTIINEIITQHNDIEEDITEWLENHKSNQQADTVELSVKHDTKMRYAIIQKLIKDLEKEIKILTQ
ncbi:MAG: hypothetical protein V1779_06495 [bacterium]